MEPEKPPLILAVNHNRHNLELLVQFLSQDGYRIVSATNLEELGQALNTEQHIELALVDISGFDQDIWRHCESLKQRSVPYLVLASSRQAAGIQYQSLQHGAKYVLVKPMAKRELHLILEGYCKKQHYAPDSTSAGS